MGKSTSGPDWTDISMLMGAIGTVHDCHVSLTVTALGQGHNGILRIIGTATWPKLGEPENLLRAQVESEWPNKVGRDFASEVFECCYRLDHAIGREHEQLELPSA
jgi:hypothetical protein